MSYKPYYLSGDHNAICDVCGREFKASRLVKRWDGFMVCREDWEPRHPQDFVRAKADLQAPQWTRPESKDMFVPIYNQLYYAGNLVNANVINTGIIG